MQVIQRDSSHTPLSVGPLGAHQPLAWTGAGSFERGACSLGWGAAGAIIFTVLQVPVVMLGYYVPHTYDRSGKVYPSVNIASTAAR
jgi:hypothetical protein